MCVDTPCRWSAAGLLPQEASEGPKSFSRVSDRHSSGCGDSTGISFSLQFCLQGLTLQGAGCCSPTPGVSWSWQSIKTESWRGLTKADVLDPQGLGACAQER